MAHIDLPAGLPGIRGPMVFSPETGKPLRALAQVLLYEPHTLTPGERELIAAYLSAQNACVYCEASHSARNGATAITVAGGATIASATSHAAASAGATHIARYVPASVACEDTRRSASRAVLHSSRFRREISIRHAVLSAASRLTYASYGSMTSVSPA